LARWSMVLLTINSSGSRLGLRWNILIFSEARLSQHACFLLILLLLLLLMSYNPTMKLLVKQLYLS
jgi:hypothetical protein